MPAMIALVVAIAGIMLPAIAKEQKDRSESKILQVNSNKPPSGNSLHFNGVGGRRFFHKLSMLSRYLMSSWKSFVNKMFSPNDAMNGLTGSVADSTARISLLRRFRRTFVALAHAFLDEFDLTFITRSARFDQWYICCQTHTIHMISGCSIVKSI
ncbi:hypothetical protein ALC56_06982 [Trachymyrmex septentrionalis]|uniref:Uncharacterized protein n=1 Tax=Trachymyrmex septentrionalis TaxID=34720 RepID=A0A151JWA1_9HYME|nr:hypothetical protein ALC56_06982 [Trachymyrmex septentrionalis]